MGGTANSKSGRRYRRARRLRNHERGVVAVIGTLLALLVFFALFGVFLTQYVPVWMTDNEAYFTSQAATSMAQFKSGLDSQWALNGPQVIGTPFTLASAAVPLIAQPTQGTLDFIPNTCPYGFFNPVNAINATEKAHYGQPRVPTYCVFVNVTESYGPGGIVGYSQSVPTGVFEFLLPNRYYSPETFYMEDDAVIQSQSASYQIMSIPPPLNFTQVGANTSVSDSFVQLYGNASSVVGQGSEEVYTHLRYSSTVTSNGAIVAGTLHPLTFTFTIGTQWPCAWNNYLYHVLTTSGLPAGNITYQTNFAGNNTNLIQSTYGGACSLLNGQTSILSFSIVGVDWATLYLAGFGIGMGVGSD
jgi:hypothetical protein